MPLMSAPNEINTAVPVQFQANVIYAVVNSNIKATTLPSVCISYRCLINMYLIRVQ